MTVSGGDEILASDINDVLALLPAFAVKSSDQDLTTSSTSLQDVAGLSVTVAASTNYAVEGWIRYTAASNTPDLRINYSYPSGASFARTDWGHPNGSTTAADSVDVTVQTTGDNGRGAGTTERSLYVKGYLAVSSTAGTFKVRAAQVTSSADKVTIKSGSRIVLTKIP